MISIHLHNDRLYLHLRLERVALLGEVLLDLEGTARNVGELLLGEGTASGTGLLKAEVDGLVLLAVVLLASLGVGAGSELGKDLSDLAAHDAAK